MAADWAARDPATPPQRNANLATAPPRPSAAPAEAPRGCRRCRRPPGAVRRHAEGAAAPDCFLRQGGSAPCGARTAVVAARIGRREDLPPSASPRPHTPTGAGEDAGGAPSEGWPQIGPRLIRLRRRRGPKILQRRRRAPAPRRRKHSVVAAAAVARQGRCAATPRALRPPTSAYARGKARLAEPAPPSSQRESDDGKTSPRRRHSARRGRCGQAKTHGRPALASPFPMLDVADCRGFAAPGAHRVDPSTTPPRPCAFCQSAPAPEGRFVAMRAGGAGTVGSISSPRKRRAMPTIAIGDAEFDRVGDALDASPSRPLPSTPPDIHSPSLTNDCPQGWPARPTRVHPCQQHDSSAGPCSRRPPTTRERPSRMGRRPERASRLTLPDIIPGTRMGVIPPLPQRRQPSRLRRPQHASRRPDHAPSRAGRCLSISARPRGRVRRHACRLCRDRRLDLSSGEEDGDADLRRLCRRPLSRRLRP